MGSVVSPAIADLRHQQQRQQQAHKALLSPHHGGFANKGVRRVLIRVRASGQAKAYGLGFRGLGIVG